MSDDKEIQRFIEDKPLKPSPLGSTKEKRFGPFGSFLFEKNDKYFYKEFLDRILGIQNKIKMVLSPEETSLEKLQLVELKIKIFQDIDTLINIFKNHYEKLSVKSITSITSSEENKIDGLPLTATIIQLPEENNENKAELIVQNKQLIEENKKLVSSINKLNNAINRKEKEILDFKDKVAKELVDHFLMIDKILHPVLYSTVYNTAFVQLNEIKQKLINCFEKIKKIVVEMYGEKYQQIMYNTKDQITEFRPKEKSK